MPDKLLGEACVETIYNETGNPTMLKPLAEPWFRLAYVTPHPIVDNVAYQFYRIAPDGVMLMLANLEIGDYTIEAVARELPLFWRHVEELARGGADRIVLTGVPVSAALGRERVLALIHTLFSRSTAQLWGVAGSNSQSPQEWIRLPSRSKIMTAGARVQVSCSSFVMSPRFTMSTWS